MLSYAKGNILNTDAEALVNTVNCVGIMGRGIALQFKNVFPENFKAYAAACRRQEVHPGRMFVFETGRMTNPKIIINFPTKRHWKSNSRMEDIESGLRALVHEIRNRDIRSMAIPPLGAGLGGLPWPDVRRRIEDALRSLDDLQITVYEPTGAPDPKSMSRPVRIPRMTAGRAALVALMHRYLGGLMDPFITLLEVHKLLYFLQEAGQPLRLRYVKHVYGPYAENLRHVLRDIEGHFVSGYADGGDQPDKPLDLVPGAIGDARTVLSEDDVTTARLKRVGDLVDGYETPFGLELLATVHWVVRHQAADSPDDVVTKVHAWNDRKKRFTPRQIATAFDTLVHKGWLACL